ncbi:N-methylhydantoinase A [Constrictibacter sp. MBR-5]|jgi:N-methylhydantoinase A|uniref:hydantoinase/oxoprolinase family protein n=1 Tax=Constrictibacter sp. MBR-5 TaxID=3156467 RepID=UPI00339728B7
MSEKRIAIDIGGTFTDVVLEHGGSRTTAKVLTTHGAPERGVMEGVAGVLAEAGVAAADVGLVIHGTTLATNALIERKGARTALVTTEGFRDAVEMAYEHRFDQYDLYMERPEPLAPRDLRFAVPERIAADGEVLLPLDEAAVAALVPALRAANVAAVAVGFLHSYVNPAHEDRAAAILAEALPDVAITRSADVCPEMREYERFSTALANAYVQPLMSGYLGRLETRLRAGGVACPLLLVMSSGGVTTIETARAFPIRLVESGPAGGAILARNVAAECGLNQVLSFDMGGTTAKICLIDDFKPQLSRSFEVARMQRFLKGSGLPLRIPVIEMVEIGAGGGSLAAVDTLGRITVGPESAGSEPGPACYGRGGTRPTVTDADLVMGRIDPVKFAGGRVPLDAAQAAAAVDAMVGRPLDLPTELAAGGIAEIVDENMGNAARVHAVESGKDLPERGLIAFGGAAPLHAARLAEKLGIGTAVVPMAASVGSAVGFLRAPIAYEVVRSRYVDMRRYDSDMLTDLFAGMRAEAESVVRMGAPHAPLVETRTAYMRYRGQGHEIAVPLPEARIGGDGGEALRAAFEDAYRQLYGRIIPNLTVEAMSWSLALATEVPLPERADATAGGAAAMTGEMRLLYDIDAGTWREVPVYWRPDLSPGETVAGPAVIAEPDTATVVTANFDATVNAVGHLVLNRRSAP